VNLLGDNIDNIKKNTETLTEASWSRSERRGNQVYVVVLSPE
jgi:hypothetical protein